LKYYLESTQSVLNELSTTENGLTSAEAESRLEKYGKNKLAEGKKDGLVKRFFAQLADPMIIILIVAAAISAATSLMEGKLEADVFIILAVVLINAVLGVFQESKAEKAIEALKEMSAATSKVIRDGEVIPVKSEDLVPGDVIILEAGDAVPADARLIESASIKSEEAALTGESVPVGKIAEELKYDGGDVALGDRKNMVYSASTIVYGRGKAVVTDTGMNTEVGKIADAITQAQEGKTPLQIKLAQLSKILTFLVLGICVFIFVFGLLREGSFSFDSILHTFMVAVSLAVAAIPEGLVAVVTIVLSMGVTKMSKRSAIIRKLTAVETLGCTQVICSDKTGTLTQNKMTVVDHYGSDEKLLAGAMALCSDAELKADGAEGEPTECALVNYAASLELDKNILKDKMPRIGEAPFDSSRKMMSTVHKDQNGKIIQYTKGAPDVVVSLCSHYFENGQMFEMTEEKKTEIMATNKALADKALRVLSAAMKIHTAEPQSFEPKFLENNLCFIGLTGMIDPVRDEVKPAVEKCREAGIRPIMITGDHLDTAVAIAKELGIVENAEGAVTGAMLDKFTDEEMIELVPKFFVYARVQPEHKTRIVNAWKANGMVTAMTGDGVNDAPSIKSADIGIGMGITGTDVTKNVADIVLADDNFATIVSAVEEGRKIYDNIRKAIQFLLASNMSEVISIFAATMMGFVILEPVHLLWINLITDCFPALALGMEKSERDVMNRKPRPTTDGIFANGVGFDVIYQGILTSVLVLTSYFIGHYLELGSWNVINSETSVHGITMAFLTMSLTEIFHSLNMRSQRGSLFTIKGMNWWLIGAMVLSFVLTTAVIEIPFLADIFGFNPVGIIEYGIAFGIAFSIIPLVEIIKLIQRIIAKSKQK